MAFDMVSIAKAAIAARRDSALRGAGGRRGALGGGADELAVRTGAGDTRVLVYRPVRQVQEPLPVFVSMHGGGFVMGSAADDDGWCRRLADAAGCAVVSVDYRLAPEHKFPVALEECYAVARWLCANAAGLGVDAGRIAVGGHSAGGNLAAGLCLLAKERREFSIVYQVLDYPPLDLTVDPYEVVTGDKLLTPATREFFTACYVNSPEDKRNPLLSPLLADDLSGLPPALVITAELDPIRGDGERYAARLKAAGVEVAYREFAGCMHAFTHFGPQEAALAAWDLIADKLREAFARG
ncbi:alpha/beta hydrolase [Anaeroselena agilis]|uniref:Alpha/beta hydrolase n=1 Tax=Anaeroselena agilis TaxID=3063788 RepID=A0ABU3P0Z1_9FIRM|nr:alpha/beta hydrolase [Selenomonadales bacterium 4137-cl]